MTDFRTDSAPDVSLRTAVDTFTRLPHGWYDPVIQVKLVWIDDLTLEYALAKRTAYEKENCHHSTMCALKARLPIDRAMAWTRAHRMSAKKIWVTQEPDHTRPNDLICSHRIVFKNANHAFAFKMSWC